MPPAAVSLDRDILAMAQVEACVQDCLDTYAYGRFAGVRGVASRRFEFPDRESSCRRGFGSARSEQAAHGGFFSEFRRLFGVYVVH